MRLGWRIGITIAAIPLLLEIVARVDDCVRFGVPLLSQPSGIGDLLVIDSSGVHGRPGTSYRQFHINRMGFRGPEVDQQELRRSFRVAITGSSESFGLYETDANEWPQQLERTLDSLCRPLPTAVLNAANAGMTLPWVPTVLERRLIPHGPSAVVYYPQPTQYLWDSVPKRPDFVKIDATSELTFQPRSIFRLRTQLKEGLPAWLLTYLRARDTQQSRETARLFTRFPADRLDAFDLHLRELVGTAHRHQIPMIFVKPYHRFTDTVSRTENGWLHGWERQLPKATPALLLAFSDSAVRRIEQVARDSSVTLVDPAFPRRASRASFFADPVHFTDLGAKRVADVVAGGLPLPKGCHLPSNTGTHSGAAHD